MNTPLNGKIILVTGASAGIGLATAETLARAGAKVIACARNIQKLQELNAALGKEHAVLAVKCDVSQESDVLALFKEIADKYGKLDVLINNAGMMDSASSLVDGDYKAWKGMLDVNILGLTLAAREAIKLIESGGSQGGHIINVNSIGGHHIPKMPMAQFYSGTKHMVTALTEGLRKSVQSKNIRVTSLSPGRVETEFIGRTMGPEKQDMAKAFYNQYKCLESKDIADAVVYILSVPAHVNIDELTITPLQQDSI